VFHDQERNPSHRRKALHKYGQQHILSLRHPIQKPQDKIQELHLLHITKEKENYQEK